MASYGEASGDPEPIAPRRLGQLGSIFLTHPSLPDYTATRADLLACAGDLIEVVRRGIVRVPVTRTFPLAEAAQAHAHLEGRHSTGAIVLLV